MFEKYDPRKNKMIRVLEEKGELTSQAKSFNLMNDSEVISAYKYLLKTRAADNWAVSLQRQGRMPTYPPNKGQEANSIASLMALNKDDWFVQSFRELGGTIVRDIPLYQTYLYYYGNEMGSNLPSANYYTLPVSVPIASQFPHAIGLAYAEKIKKTGRIAIVFVGDGGTSQGDFHEAMNFAGIMELPVIFYVQNNHFAISMARRHQTASETIAEKAFSYGFEGVQVDGNDILAVHAVTKMAAENARKHNKPTLIEGFSYRLGAHTTADDPTRYRDDQEVEQWIKKDPILRTEAYVLKNKLMTQKEIDERFSTMHSDIMKIVWRERKKALVLTKPFIQHFIDHHKGESKRGMERIHDKGPFAGQSALDAVLFAKALLKEME